MSSIDQPSQAKESKTNFSFKLTADRLAALGAEFTSLPPPLYPFKDYPAEQFHRITSGIFTDLYQPAMQGRTRYTDIIAYNVNRYKIASDPTFVYNASIMLNGRAIACEAPQDNNLNEFWRMIWDATPTALVMLTNLFQGSTEKCRRYWPEKVGESTTFGEITVKNVGEQTLFTLGGSSNEAIVARSLEYASAGSDQKRTTTQFHLTNWPDFGVVDAKTLAQLVVLLENHTKAHPGVVLTHCTAGVGRTGCLLAVWESHRLIQAGNGEGSDLLVIKEVTSKMRRPEHGGREGMIQTPEQYTLAHQALQLLHT